MQRFVGVTCMVFNQPVLHAQIERDSMIFSTMGSWHASGQWLIFCLTYSLALTTVCLRFKATVLFRSELSSYSWNHWENFKGCKNQGLLTCHQGRPWRFGHRSCLFLNLQGFFLLISSSDQFLSTTPVNGPLIMQKTWTISTEYCLFSMEKYHQVHLRSLLTRCQYTRKGIIGTLAQTYSLWLWWPQSDHCRPLDVY